MSCAYLGAALVLVAALAASCAPSGADPSAPYFPTSRPAASSPPAVDPSVALPATQSVAKTGPVAMPNPKLTPGVVATRDVGAVCQQPKRVRSPIPFAQQQAIFTAYGIPASETHRYGLDYLVPLQLGGATVNANLWPAATRGVGFYDKQSLNARLRLLVCGGQLALADAQRDIAADWYTEWLKYGA